MPSRCSVRGCSQPLRPVHRFPHPITDFYQRFETWLTLLGRKELLKADKMKIYSNRRICSKHFSGDHFVLDKKRTLKKNAIPDINLPDPEKDVTSSDETPSVELNDSDSITDAREKVQISTVSILSTLGSQNDTTCLSSNSTGDCSAEDSDNEAHPEGEEPVLENNPTTIQRYIYRHVENPSHVIEESPELYALVTLPFLEQTNLDLQWVYKILSGEEGSSRVIYQSPNKDDKDGFLMIKGFRWDGVNLYNLHVLAIVYRPGILSLRDLRGDHLSLLQNIFCIGKEQIIRKYGVEESQLRIFVQYQPSFFHFNVHFTAMNDGIC
ncbi:hypothetical protein J437_LFUL013044, partial [Ladona fulva]